jgi:hypothetical protein
MVLNRRICMSFYKIFVLSLVVAFSFSGCGSNNSDAPTSTGGGNINLPVDNNTTIDETSAITVVLPVSSTVLSTNSQVVTIDVRAFDSLNNPYSGGNIKLIGSPDGPKGRDVGEFSSIVAPLANGVATFTYTGPKDLKADTSNLYFGFFPETNASNVQIYTMSIVPEVNQTILTSYEIKSGNDKNVTMDLNASKTVGYTVYDQSNNKVTDDNIVSLTVTSLNPNLVLLSNTSSQTDAESISSTKNNITINLNSNTKSGLVPIKVDAVFVDENGKTQHLTKVYSIIVYSGPITAISLSYAGTKNNDTDAKFIENWVLSATDKYNNLVNTHPSISVGMLAGYAQSSGTLTNVANYLYSIPNQAGSGGGTINGSNGTFTANENVFGNVDYTHDYLVTFGNGYTYEVSGKWDVNENSNKILNLVDDYNETKNVPNLGFAVGNNYRQDRCHFGDEWIGNVYPKDNNYILGDNGSKIIEMSYDYYLVGKDVMLWTNLVGSAQGKIQRIGESRKVTLRGDGLDAETYDFSKGYVGVVRLKISVKDTTEWYYNSNFGYSVRVSGDDVNWTVAGSSMDNGIISCKNDGIAYVDVNITGAGNAGTVSLSNLKVSNEF